MARLLAVSSLAVAGTLASVVVAALPASASAISPFQASWCTGQGASVVGWTATSPNLPICGMGPDYGGSWGYVDIPGPYGSLGTYYNATPGFQCVELAERYLAVVAGLAPVKANGAQVAENYHAAYPSTSLYVNGTASAVGHPPAAGDVISFAASSDFTYSGDGHVAIVVSSSVDGAGNGRVVIAQENVAPGDYVRSLALEGWRLSDPSTPGDAEFQFPAAEWLAIPSSLSATPAATGGPTASPGLVTSPSGQSGAAATSFVLSAQVRRLSTAERVKRSKVRRA